MKLASILVLAAACGGSPKPAPAPAPMGEQGEMAHATPELMKFHDVLAPRWHAAKGPERMTATCGAIADFSTGADAIAKAPAGDPGRWAQEAKELTDAVAAMKIVCETKDVTKFETAFANVHQEFHELLEVAEGKHEEHEEKHAE
jgi:hypothetical protein